MSATMASQGDWVQLEQSDIHQVWNMATIVKESFSQTAIGGNTKPDEESSQ
jgi:hypothetical protein